MAKQLAHKKTRELLTEAEIKEKKRNIGEFSASWQGRIFMLQPDKSKIAKDLEIVAKGEYAIKVR